MTETNKPDYIIVSGVNHIDLAARVNKKIKEGYIPTGGLTTNKGKDGTAYFFQAMVTSFLVENNGAVFDMEPPEIYEN